jgi:hypothetical protein
MLLDLSNGRQRARRLSSKLSLGAPLSSGVSSNAEVSTENPAETQIRRMFGIGARCQLYMAASQGPMRTLEVMG